MMNPNDARLLDMCAYDLLLGDCDRGLKRALVNELFNGEAPYTPEEVRKNKIRINVNDLTGTKLAHDSRSQYFNGIMTQGRYFTASTDMGPTHRREINSAICMKEANKVLKDSIGYFESQRSDIASCVLHGISPGVWENSYGVIPRPIGVEDALIPMRTLLGFPNLPYIFLRRQFTGMELEDITRAHRRDPGWNLDLVNRCLEYLDNQITINGSNLWPGSFAFEKWT
jgi:hypothetical protein